MSQDCGVGFCPAEHLWPVSEGFGLGHSAPSITPRSGATEYSSDVGVWCLNGCHLACGLCNAHISHQLEPFYFRNQNGGGECANLVLIPGFTGSYLLPVKCT